MNKSKSTINLCVAKNLECRAGTTITDYLSSDQRYSSIVKLNNIELDTTSHRSGANLQKAKWKKFRQNLYDEITINSQLDHDQDIDHSIAQLTTAIVSAVSTSTPRTAHKQNGHSLPQTIKKL